MGIDWYDMNMINGRIGFKEQKYIWSAVKP